MRELLHTLKYDGIYEAADVFVDLARERYGVRMLEGMVRNAVLVPVPSTPQKRKARGYAQAQEMARALSGLLGVSVQVDLLLTDKKNESQVGKGEWERKSETDRWFKAVKNHIDPQAYYFLVDDLRTTGSTLQACAKVIREAGGRIVGAIVMAHNR